MEELEKTYQKEIHNQKGDTLKALHEYHHSLESTIRGDLKGQSTALYSKLLSGHAEKDTFQEQWKNELQKIEKSCDLSGLLKEAQDQCDAEKATALDNYNNIINSNSPQPDEKAKFEANVALQEANKKADEKLKAFRDQKAALDAALAKLMGEDLLMQELSRVERSLASQITVAQSTLIQKNAQMSYQGVDKLNRKPSNSATSPVIDGLEKNKYYHIGDQIGPTTQFKVDEHGWVKPASSKISIFGDRKAYLESWGNLF